jgi:hypothetical protein
VFFDELKTFFFFTFTTTGQQRALTLVNPVSKEILQEAMKADCDFLSKSNIMDYSYDYYSHSSSFFSTYEMEFFFSGCCSVLMKRESRSIVALWTPLGAIRLQRLWSTRRRDFRGKKAKISPLSLLTSTKNALCPLWIDISWRVQVRICSNVRIPYF